MRTKVIGLFLYWLTAEEEQMRIFGSFNLVKNKLPHKKAVQKFRKNSV